MDRDIPTFNHLIMNKMNQKNLEAHQKRLQNIKPTQKTRNYLSSSLNFRQNKKAEMLQEQKKTEIEKHNNMLFNKMMNIMKRTDPVNRPASKNDKNSAKIIAENSKIQEENRNLFERIEKQKPTINNRKLYEQRRKNLNILKFLGKYSPHSVQSTNSQSLKISQGSSRAINSTYQANRKTVGGSKHEHYLQQNDTYEPPFAKKDRYHQIEFDEQINEDDFDHLKNEFNNERIKIKSVYEKMYERKENENEQYSRLSRESQLPKKMPSSKPLIPREAKDIILFKTTKSYNGSDYEVKIIRKHNSYEIQLINLETDQYKLIEYTQSEGNVLLEENQYNYPMIINQIAFDNNGEASVVGHQTQEDMQAHYEDNKDENIDNEQQDTYAKIHSFKNNQMRFNPSHISEQNEEESYVQGALQQQTYRDKNSFIRNQHIKEQNQESCSESQKRSDSLGQSDKQFAYHYKNAGENGYEMEEAEKRQLEVKEKGSTPTKIEFNGHNSELKSQAAKNDKVKLIQQHENAYEQALDEQIL